MKLHLKGAAKRLTFSLIAAAALSGCAIYEPGYPGYGSYDPYAYGPAYPSTPYYVGPPVSLGLWFDSRSGGGHHGYHGGHRGGWGGRHR
jgi:hypothetical protein